MNQQMLYPNYLTLKFNAPLTSITITPYDMICIKLRALDITKSPGSDGVHPHVLKELVEPLAEPPQLEMCPSEHE